MASKAVAAVTTQDSSGAGRGEASTAAFPAWELLVSPDATPSRPRVVLHSALAAAGPGPVPLCSSRNPHLLALHPLVTSPLYAQAPPTAAAVSLSASRWKRKARLRRPVQNLALLTMADLPRTKKANQRKGNGRSRSTEGGRAARGTQAPRRPTPSRHPAFPRLAHASRAAVAGDEVGATRR